MRISHAQASRRVLTGAPNGLICEYTRAPPRAAAAPPPPGERRMGVVGWFRTRPGRGRGSYVFTAQARSHLSPLSDSDTRRSYKRGRDTKEAKGEPLPAAAVAPSTRTAPKPTLRMFSPGRDSKVLPKRIFSNHMVLALLV